MNKCNICHSTNVKQLYKAKLPKQLSSKDFNITDSKYSMHSRLVQCQKCGFVFSSPRPSPRRLTAYYNALEDTGYDKESKGRKVNFNTILDNIEQIIPKKGKLLDVGCASGMFMDEARKRNWETTGVEPSQWLSNSGRKKYRLDIITGTIDDVPKQKFDAITLLDVIEHVPNPKLLLKKCYALLSTNGVLAVVTPDISSYLARKMGEKWWHIRIAHVSYFSQKTLFNILLRAKLIPVVKKHYKWNFSFNYWHSRVAGYFPGLYNVTKLVFRVIPGFNRAVGKRNISIDFKDSTEWYCIKNCNTKYSNGKYVNLQPLITKAFFTSLFTGYFPLIPATFTSFLVTLISYFLISDYFNLIFQSLFFFGLVFYFLFDPFRPKVFKQKDPREITIDEAIGMFAILSFIPATAKLITFSFILFRFIDIFKPFPIGYIEKNMRYGILFDDIIAAAYTLIIMKALMILL